MNKIQIHKIQKSKRKTISLLITADAKLTVKAPHRVSQKYIEQVIEQKRKWIEKKIKEVSSQPKFKAHNFTNGEEFLFLGKTHQLKIQQIKSVTLNSQLIAPNLPTDQLKNKIVKWYKKEALKYFETRTLYFSQKMNAPFARVRLSTAKKQWGSCSYDNVISLNWKLIMAPSEIIDYVIVHELAHVHEKNHSKNFWRLVEKILPDYKSSRLWLKENGETLNI